MSPVPYKAIYKIDTLDGQRVVAESPLKFHEIEASHRTGSVSSTSGSVRSDCHVDYVEVRLRGSWFLLDLKAAKALKRALKRARKEARGG